MALTEKCVLIVAATEGFIIKGIETKLKGIGVQSVFAVPQVKDLQGKCEDISLVMIYTDDRIGNYADALVYLKDFCAEKDKQFVVIGGREEYDTLSRLIPDNLIFRFYERPLDMETMLNDLEKYMEDESQYARRKSILIVDDDVSYMSMIRDWLKDEYRVSLANSGMEAITWIVKNHVDLILLDYEMPVISGPKVLEMIRSDAATQSIPVMFLTGKGDKDSVLRVVSLKPAGYVLKNVERAELKETLSNFFASHM